MPPVAKWFSSFQGLGTPQFAVAGLLLAVAYVVYVVLVSIDEGFRLLERQKHVALKLSAYAFLHVAVILALFVAPADAVAAYMLWTVVVFACGYTVLAVYVHTQSFRRAKHQLLTRDLPAFKTVLRATHPDRLDLFLRKAQASDGMRLAMVDSAQDVIFPRQVLANAAGLRELLASKTEQESNVLLAEHPDAYALALVASAMADTVPRSAVPPVLMWGEAELPP